MRKAELVLCELLALDEKSPGGWWQPYQVRYHRDDSPLHFARTTIEATTTILRELARENLCGRGLHQGKHVYRINDAGRAAVARAKGETT